MITTFGVANAANEPEKPIGYDSAGRPIFNHPFGQGFSLILEVRAGANRHNPGLYPAPYYAGEDLHDPDMQMILSRPLGNGSPVICDTSPPDHRRRPGHFAVPLPRARSTPSTTWGAGSSTAPAN